MPETQAPMNLDTLTQMVAGTDANGESADGRFAARINGEFELVELSGPGVDEQIKQGVCEAVNAALVELQARIFEQLEGTFTNQEPGV